MDKLIHMVGYTLIPVGCLLFYQEFKILHMTFTGSAQSTVAALVGMIPEGLYLLTSIALAVSAMKLTRQRVLVQDMNCIESLARVDVLCVDKTGTITQPTMEVENLLPLGDREPEYLEQVLKSLYGSREPDNDTARAIQELFSGKGDWECTRYVPFTSQTKWCGGEFGEQGSFVVGAPEFILGEHFGKLREQVAPWASTGYRVLLVAAYPGELPRSWTAALLSLWRCCSSPPPSGPRPGRPSPTLPSRGCVSRSSPVTTPRRFPPLPSGLALKTAKSILTPGSWKPMRMFSGRQGNTPSLGG